MKTNKTPAIILFVKVPRIGFVKTRLISELISEKEAYELQIEMIKDTLLTLSSITLEFQPIISFYPKNEIMKLKDLINTFSQIIPKTFLEKLMYIPQLGNSIGQHFSSTFKQVFELPNISSVAIIGGDTPHVHSLIFSQTINFLQMNKKNAVIGPSQMGGFYLFGLTESISIGNIFSKPNEFENLIELCSQFKLSTKILPFIFDLDEFQDVQSLYFIFNPLMKKKRNIAYDHEIKFPNHTLNYIKNLFSKKQSN